VRNVSPIGDVLDEEPDEIVIINCNSLKPERLSEPPAHGLTLHLPSGRQLRYYESHIIEPQAPLGDTLDFSQEAIQHSLQAGWEQAKIVLGD
jgi:hypothetical protein